MGAEASSFKTAGAPQSNWAYAIPALTLLSQVCDLGEKIAKQKANKHWERIARRIKDVQNLRDLWTKHRDDIERLQPAQLQKLGSSLQTFLSILQGCQKSLEKQSNKRSLLTSQARIADKLIGYLGEVEDAHRRFHTNYELAVLASTATSPNSSKPTSPTIKSPKSITKSSSNASVKSPKHVAIIEPTKPGLSDHHLSESHSMRSNVTDNPIRAGMPESPSSAVTSRPPPAVHSSAQQHTTHHNHPTTDTTSSLNSSTKNNNSGINGKGTISTSTTNDNNNNNNNSNTNSSNNNNNNNNSSKNIDTSPDNHRSNSNTINSTKNSINEDRGTGNDSSTNILHSSAKNHQGTTNTKHSSSNATSKATNTHDNKTANDTSHSISISSSDHVKVEPPGDKAEVSESTRSVHPSTNYSPRDFDNPIRFLGSTHHSVIHVQDSDEASTSSPGSMTARRTSQTQPNIVWRSNTYAEWHNRGLHSHHQRRASQPMHPSSPFPPRSQLGYSQPSPSPLGASSNKSFTSVSMLPTNMQQAPRQTSVSDTAAHHQASSSQQAQPQTESTSKPAAEQPDPLESSGALEESLDTVSSPFLAHYSNLGDHPKPTIGTSQSVNSRSVVNSNPLFDMQCPTPQSSGKGAAPAVFTEAKYLNRVGMLMEAAEQGDAQAAVTLGMMFRTGTADIEVDLSRARQLFLRAVDLKEPAACFHLGEMAEHGEGLAAPDLVEAGSWYRMGADQGHCESMACYAYLLEHGYGVAQNEIQARKWYREAALLNNPTGQNNLANMLLDGRGGSIDVENALEWFRHAANNGSVSAMYNLGACQQQGLGVPASDADALHSYLKAAEAGHVAAQVAAGHLYMAKSQFSAARTYFEMAAARNDTNALHGLALLSEREATLLQERVHAMMGLDTRPWMAETPTSANVWELEHLLNKKQEQTKQLHMEAARAGHSDSQVWMANYLWDSGHIEPSLQYYHAAATQGNAKALIILGMMAEHGRGMDRGFDKAMTFYRMAAAHGSDEGVAQVERLQLLLQQAQHA